MIPVAILAGGRATRLGPTAERIPKALIEVGGTPFVAHQLRLLRREGIARVVLCVGHFGEMIRQVVGDGGQFGLEVVYSFDGDKLLGTGGALPNAGVILSPYKSTNCFMRVRRSGLCGNWPASSAAHLSRV